MVPPSTLIGLGISAQRFDVNLNRVYKYLVSGAGPPEILRTCSEYMNMRRNTAAGVGGAPNMPPG